MDFEQGLEVADEAVFTRVGRRLNHAEITIMQGSWYKKTYEEIAKDTNYSVSYLRRGVGPGLWKILSIALKEEVSKTNFKLALESKWRQQKKLGNRNIGRVQTTTSSLTTQNVASKADWGEAIDVSTFYGRIDELATLKKWVVSDKCRLITILGMGGMGKTAVAVKLAQQVQLEFEYVIWRSLRNAPPIQDILADLIQFFEQEQNNLPKSLDSRILNLVAFLRSNRCLLLLDNIESVLQTGDIKGSYREGYEDYNQLFCTLAEAQHQSCLVITTREKPKNFSLKEGNNLPIRSLHLSGLQLAEGQKLFQIKGEVTGSTSAWESVITHYAGNPLALKILAIGIQDFFEGNLDKFIEFCVYKAGSIVFDDLLYLLESQFQRLSNIELTVMCLLAIIHKPISFNDLQDFFCSQQSKRDLLEALTSLQRRAIINKLGTTFTQYPVVVEYFTEKFMTICYKKIFNNQITIFWIKLVLYGFKNEEVSTFGRDTKYVRM